MDRITGSDAAKTSKVTHTAVLRLNASSVGTAAVKDIYILITKTCLSLCILKELNTKSKGKVNIELILHLFYIHTYSSEVPAG